MNIREGKGNLSSNKQVIVMKLGMEKFKSAFLKGFQYLLALILEKNVKSNSRYIRV